MEIGYALSSEEHAPSRSGSLRAAGGGGRIRLRADLRPLSSLGRSTGTESVRLVHHRRHRAGDQSTCASGTGVTCPIMRIHPAIIAQAAATAAAMMPGRFFLGLGTGENLNEHILGDHWPEGRCAWRCWRRRSVVLRLLWEGGEQSHRGALFHRRAGPPLHAAGGAAAALSRGRRERAAELAGRAADGLIGVAPEAELIDQFAAAGGKRKPRYGQVTVCYAGSDATARRIAHEWWPTAGLQGQPELGDQDARRCSSTRSRRSVKTTSRNRSCAVPTAIGTWRRSTNSSTQDTTMYTCTRSGPIRSASSASTKSPCCHCCAVSGAGRVSRPSVGITAATSQSMLP